MIENLVHQLFVDPDAGHRRIETADLGRIQSLIRMRFKRPITTRTGSDLGASMPAMDKGSWARSPHRGHSGSTRRSADTISIGPRAKKVVKTTPMEALDRSWSMQELGQDGRHDSGDRSTDKHPDAVSRTTDEKTDGDTQRHRVRDGIPHRSPRSTGTSREWRAKAAGTPGMMIWSTPTWLSTSMA